MSARSVSDRLAAAPQVPASDAALVAPRRLPAQRPGATLDIESRERAGTLASLDVPPRAQTRGWT